MLAELLARCVELLGAGCMDEPGTEETVKILDKTMTEHYKRREERAGKRQSGEEDYDEGVEEQLKNEDDEDVYNSNLPGVVTFIAEALAVDVLLPDHAVRQRIVSIVKQVQVTKEL